MLACVATADACGAVSNATTSAADANQFLTEQFGPFKLSIGQDSAGGLGANLDGKGRTAFGHIDTGNEPEGGQARNWFWYFPNLTYAATGTWGTAQSATNNASLSLKPGADGLLAYGLFDDPSLRATPPISCDSNGHCTDGQGNPLPLATYPKPYLGVGAAGDAELRYGTIKQGGTNVYSKQLMVGGDIYVVLPQHWNLGYARDLASPRLSATYYHPANTTATSNIALPAGVKANYLQTEFQTIVGFGADNQVKLDVKYDGSKPTAGGSGPWQNLWTVKVWIPALKFNGVNPSITYQSGANGGFTYDRQVLLGVLVEFLKPKASK
jgi:hypothetical protein